MFNNNNNNNNNKTVWLPCLCLRLLVGLHGLQLAGDAVNLRPHAPAHVYNDMNSSAVDLGGLESHYSD